MEYKKIDDDTLEISETWTVTKAKLEAQKAKLETDGIIREAQLAKVQEQLDVLK